MLLYQLVNFDNAAQDIGRKIRYEFKISFEQGYRWIEWNKSIRSIVPSPDFAIVYAKELGWKELISVLNQTNADNIIILGNSSGILALPCFEGDFDMRELNGYVNELLPETASPRIKISQSRWVKTIPMPLPTSKQFSNAN